MSIAELPSSTESNRRELDRRSLPTADGGHEPQRGYLSSLDDLNALNFYCFGGRRDFSTGFRALVVGHSASQSVIDLAGQLQGCRASVTYLDADEATIDAVQKSARSRGAADDVEWIEADPLNLPQLGLEPFDYVNGCRLLEQCLDPAAGLKSLASVLKPDGALGLTFLGKYGRTGLSQLRELMRIVNRDAPNADEAVTRARSVIDRLPATNWGKRGVDLFPLYGDLGDAALRDLLVADDCRDYSLPEVWDLLEAAGLLLVEHTREQRALYEPQFGFPDGPVLEAMQKLPRRDQQAAAELYWGAVTRHTFWASARPDTIAPLTDPDMIPCFTRFAAEQGIRQSILDTAGDEWSWTTRLAGEVDVSITFHVAPAARRFVELIDNRSTLAEIIETILSAYDPRPPIEEALKVCRYVMEILLRQDLLLVRHKSTPAILD